MKRPSVYYLKSLNLQGMYAWANLSEKSGKRKEGPYSLIITRRKKWHLLPLDAQWFDLLNCLGEKKASKTYLVIRTPPRIEKPKNQDKS